MLSEKSGVPWLSVLARHEQQTAAMVDMWLDLPEEQQKITLAMMNDIFEKMDRAAMKSPETKSAFDLIVGFCKHGFEHVYTKACQRMVDLQSGAQ